MDGSNRPGDEVLKHEARLRDGIRDLALAPDEDLSEEIASVEAALDALEDLLDRGVSLPWPDPVRERLGACRLELERLRTGHTSRRDAVGRLRLLVPGRSGGAATDQPDAN